MTELPKPERPRWYEKATDEVERFWTFFFPDGLLSVLYYIGIAWGIAGLTLLIVRGF